MVNMSETSKRTFEIRFVLFTFWPFCRIRQGPNQTCQMVFQIDKVQILYFLVEGIQANSIVFKVLFRQEITIHSISKGGGSR